MAQFLRQVSHKYSELLRAGKPIRYGILKIKIFGSHEVTMKSTFTFHIQLRVLIAISACCAAFLYPEKRIVIVIIVDQLSYHYLKPRLPHFTGGIHRLVSNGINYTNAYQPHGAPFTSTGHAALSTGTFANTHGIVGNNWFDKMGKNVLSDDDPSEQARVFSPSGTYDYGKSAHNLLVDTISDQTVLYNKKKICIKSPHVISFSFKSRAAIFTAGNMGKAIWFDTDAGLFTSSKAYFKELPPWLIQFNTKHVQRVNKKISWPLAHPDTPAAYQPCTNSIPTLLYAPRYGKNESRHTLFSKTPHANQITFECALTYIQKNVEKNGKDKVLIWISLSSLDQIGHELGPDSVESIDTLYHLDQQLGSFISKVNELVHKHEVAFLFTSDHGVTPIPEQMRKAGMKNARRIMYQPLLGEMNSIIQSKYQIETLVIGFRVPDFYFDQKKWTEIKHNKQNKIIGTLKEYLLKQAGILQIWSFSELQNAIFHPEQLGSFFKNQLYFGRTGQLIVQTQPYSFLTSYRKGTTHSTPYKYDTHIPLILYQQSTAKKQAINTKVWSLQVAPTIAHLLHVPSPSATTASLLPGLASLLKTNRAMSDQTRSVSTKRMCRDRSVKNSRAPLK